MLVRRATRAIFWGDTNNEYDFSSYVSEYIVRKRMKRIGLVSSFDSMPYVKTNIFTTIDTMVDKLQSEAASKK